MTTNFADRLTEKIREVGSPLCVGLDPHLDLIPEMFRLRSMSPSNPATHVSVYNFLKSVLNRLVGKVAVVKPQIAFFEQMGSRGFTALENTIDYAKMMGFLVILDAKRGDIGSTAKAVLGSTNERSACPLTRAETLPAISLDGLSRSLVTSPS